MVGTTLNGDARGPMVACAVSGYARLYPSRPGARPSAMYPVGASLTVNVFRVNGWQGWAYAGGATSHGTAFDCLLDQGSGGNRGPGTYCSNCIMVNFTILTAL